MGEWVVLELNTKGEQEDPDLVRASISQSLKNADVFVPAAVTQVGEDRVIKYLMDGYAFIRLDSDRQPNDYFKLEGSKYVQTVLIKPGQGSRYNRISTIGDPDILRMQEQIKQLTDQGIGVGDVVRITSGPYRNMRASVVEDIPEEGRVQVYIKLRSKQSLMSIPRSFLVVVERAPLSAVSNRLNALRDWAALAKPVFEWEATEPYNQLMLNYSEYSRLATLNTRGRVLHDLLTFDTQFLRPLDRMHRSYQELVKVSSWMRKGFKLFSFVSFYGKSKLDEGQLEGIRSKVIEYTWLDDLLERIRMLWEDVDNVSRAVALEENGGVTHNVLIDGHNLAFRCFYAPGMSKLMDSQGRPTGVILGFLKGVAALKKRYPEASIHVIWDGSSRRRKLQFGEYKANRNSSSMAAEAPSGIRFDPIRFLKDTLPLLGVRQAWNPEEEADDVIASLVRGSLKGENNVIFSTDRDLLQLVTTSTYLLTPAIGARNEILFNPEIVEKAVGVPPEKIVQLRSLYGDSSDNIPGVPRVPKKVLKALIKGYGSIEGIYRSGLAGLTRGQYERLRNAEPQIRINVELMTLLDVDFTVTPPDVDPDSVTTRLRELDINPEAFLDTFFGSADP